MRRIGTSLALLCAALLAAPAQAWQPEKPIEIVVPTTPGGGIDRSARLLHKIIQEEKLAPVPVSVANKPGAGGTVSLAYLNQNAGDGHVVAINSPSLIANDLNGRGTVRYREVTPLANLFSEYTVVAVRADSPLKRGQDFIDRLRSDPQSLAVSTPTTLGSTNHLSFALVAKAGGVDPRRLKAVVLGSGGDAVTALLGGHIDAHTGTPSSVVRMVQAGQIRVIGILAPKRIGGPYADTPTWTEQGYRAVMDTWRGVIGPKGMTPAQIAWWDGVLAKAVTSAIWKQALEQNTWEANYLDSAQTRKLFDSEYAAYRTILGDLGMIK
ncbi:MAG: tripartite tricarboxylate transporter substrate binding protein [Burkholderiales bacterium]|nr:tripartite tricarboxylate transporter substrate binding protein [Burkholderiales bacterium]MCW5603360.1 tripartite tricarboxylate transporter substrate binding protein [Burkholderiales bacterium]